MYGKVPCLIVKKTNRLTQAVVFFRRHFLCGALLCNCSSAEREVYLHIHVQREYSAEPFMRSILSLSPVLAYDFLSRCKFSTPTNTSTPFYSSINRLYAQNPGFEIVREESVKVYLHMHNGNVQQNPLCVEPCVTNGFSSSPRLSPTMFDPDANSVLLRAHLCTGVDFMCRKACVRNCSRELKGLYNGNVLLTHHSSSIINRLYAQNPVLEVAHGESVIVYLHMYSGNIQQNPLCVESSCVTKVFSIFPRFSPTIFYRDANSVLLQILAHLISTAVSKALCAEEPWVRNCS